MKKRCAMILALLLTVCTAAGGTLAEPEAAPLQGVWQGVEYNGEDISGDCLYLTITEAELIARNGEECSDPIAYTAENGLLVAEDVAIGYLLEGDTLTVTQSGSGEEQEVIVLRRSSQEAMDAQVAQIVEERVAKYLPMLLDRGWILMETIPGNGREVSEDPLYGYNLLLFHEDGTYVLSGAEDSDGGVYSSSTYEIVNGQLVLSLPQLEQPVTYEFIVSEPGSDGFYKLYLYSTTAGEKTQNMFRFWSRDPYKTTE